MQEVTKLTGRQHEVLVFFSETSRATGAPPAIRDVMDHFGFGSPHAAQAHLQALVRKGYLDHMPGCTPAYRLRNRGETSSVPIMGRAPAGVPSDQPEDFQGMLVLPWRYSSRAFAVRVIGDSMIGAHVVDGDLVVVEPERTPLEGDVVLALIGGAHTIKQLRWHGPRWDLHPANPAYDVVLPEQEGDRVIGSVVALVRSSLDPRTSRTR